MVVVALRDGRSRDYDGARARRVLPCEYQYLQQRDVLPGGDHLLSRDQRLLQR
jgi:hypothetical protein